MDAMVATTTHLTTFPTTPTPARISTSGLGLGQSSISNNYRPMLSSPLAPTPSTSASARYERSSPIAEAQARRRAQYKSRSSSGASRRIVSNPHAARGAPVPFALAPPQQQQQQGRAESSRAAFFRDRLQAKMRRAQAHADRRRTASSDMSSDGFDVSMAEGDSDDADDGEDGMDEEARYFSDEVCSRS